MSNASGVKIKNLRTITKALQEAGVPNKALREAGKIAGQKVLLEAKDLAPVRTGKLRDSIRLASTAAGRTTIKAGNETSIPYANPIHWGWFKRYIRPQPFFSKALGYSRDEIYQTYFAQLEEHITQVYARNKGRTDD
jgi:HK97 gp10 family phage protein